MRLLLDQDVYAVTARFLRNAGHDVVTAKELECSREPDVRLLAVALEQSRVLVTRDRDFGELVFLGGTRAGVIYLRVLPTTVNAVHEELERVLREHPVQDLAKAFTVVEPGRHRVRRLPVDR